MNDSIYDHIKTPEYGFEKDLVTLESNILDNLMRDIKQQKNPKYVYNDYFAKYNSVSKYKILDHKWSDRFENIHNNKVDTRMKMGYTVKSILLKNLPSFELEKYIKKEFNYKSIYNSGNFLKYNKYKFKKLAFIAVGMLFAKYTQVYLFEVRTAIIRTLFGYFRVYDYINGEPTWLVKEHEIFEVINDILNSSYTLLIAEFTAQTKIQVNESDNTITLKHEAIKPTSREDLLKVVDIHMSLEEKCARICARWPYYESKHQKTIQRLLSEYDLVLRRNSGNKKKQTTETTYNTPENIIVLPANTPAVIEDTVYEPANIIEEPDYISNNNIIEETFNNANTNTVVIIKESNEPTPVYNNEQINEQIINTVNEKINERFDDMMNECKEYNKNTREELYNLTNNTPDNNPAIKKIQSLEKENTLLNSKILELTKQFNRKDNEIKQLKYMLYTLSEKFGYSFEQDYS